MWDTLNRCPIEIVIASQCLKYVSNTKFKITDHNESSRNTA